MDYPELHRKLDDAVRVTADILVPRIQQLLNPFSVLDVGCGNGVWLGAFHRAGVADILGIDGDYTDRTALQIPAQHFQAVDLSKPFSLGRRFDLAVSLEVGEHLPPDHADVFVESILAHSDAVLFSAAIPGQGGVGHINEQWPSYWLKRFKLRGYRAFDAVRPVAWSDDNVVYWYAQNALLFVKESAIPNYPSLSDVPPVVLADVVHPKRYLMLDRAARAGDDPSLSHLAKSLPRAAGQFVKNQLGSSSVAREPVKLPDSK